MVPYCMSLPRRNERHNKMVDLAVFSFWESIESLKPAWDLKSSPLQRAVVYGSPLFRLNVGLGECNVGIAQTCNSWACRPDLMLDVVVAQQSS